MKKINIVSVWTWFCNILDTQSLSASEQLIMLHLIKIFNRNFWKPTQISTSALCRSCGKDARTVKRSISLLKTANLIIETDDGLFLKFDEDSAEGKTKRTTKTNPSLTKKTEPRNSTMSKIGFDYITKALTEEWKKNGGLNEGSKAIFDKLDILDQERIKTMANQTENQF